MKRIVFLLLYFFVFMSQLSLAEFRQVDLSIFGMD